MQKFVCNVTIDLKIMAAFLMTLLIGELWGQHYPQVYLWALIALFSVGMGEYKFKCVKSKEILIMHTFFVQERRKNEYKKNKC